MSNYFVARYNISKSKFNYKYNKSKLSNWKYHYKKNYYKNNLIGDISMNNNYCTLNDDEIKDSNKTNYSVTIRMDVIIIIKNHTLNNDEMIYINEKMY